jgi:hypothetical protein
MSEYNSLIMDHSACTVDGGGGGLGIKTMTLYDNKMEDKTR